MQWSPQQDEASSRVAAWLKSGRPQVFRLFGYAGTGKTTLARHFAEGSTARSPSAPSPARPRTCCAARAATTRPPSTASSTGPQVGEEEGPHLRHQPRGGGVEGRPHRHRRMLDGGRGSRPRPPVLRRAGAGAGRSGAAPARQGRRLLHRRRARRDADRGAPAGARQPDHPHVHGGARGRAARARRATARARSSAAPISTPPRAGDRPGAGRHQPHAPALQQAHPRAARACAIPCRPSAKSSSACATTSRRACSTAASGRSRSCASR